VRDPSAPEVGSGDALDAPPRLSTASDQFNQDGWTTEPTDGQARRWLERSKDRFRYVVPVLGSGVGRGVALIA
jgi:hypothetical protein